MAEFIEILSPSALKDLQTANVEVLTLIKNIDNAGKSMQNIKTPSGSDSAVKNLNAKLIQQEKLYTDLQIKLERYAQAQQQTAIKNNQLEASTIRLNKQKEVTIKQLEREQAKLEASTQIYNKVQQKLNALTNEYKNLAVKKELSGKLTDAEAKRYDYLSGRITKYDNILKAVDASMGKYQRNVGNYASAFNPLSNSINQLTREMPAFANSVQTGFMAISNNLPIFFDAMQGIVAQNKVLQAQGQPTTSVLKQLAGSFLSVGTALSVGVTLLTVFGDEIVDAIFNTKAKQKADEEAKLAIEAKNKAEQDYIDTMKKAGSEEISRSQILFENAKNVNMSMRDRLDAIKQLRERYPDYLNQLSNEQILSGQTADAENRLNDALMKRGIAIALQGKLTEQYNKLSGVLINISETQAKSQVLTKTDIDLAKKLGVSQAQLAKDKQLAGNLQLAQFTKQQANINSEIESIFKLYNQYSPYLSAVRESSDLTDKDTKKKEENLKVTEQINSSSLEALSNTIAKLKQSYESAEIGSVQFGLLANQIKLLEEIYRGLTTEINEATDAKEEFAGIELTDEQVYDEYFAWLKLKQATDDYLKTLSSDAFNKAFDNIGLSSAKMFLDFDVNGETTFSKLIAGADSFKEKFAITFQAVGDVAQDIFSKIFEMQNQRFTNELTNLEREKDIAILFAGESASAREEINRQYDIKQRDIKNREARAKKGQAIFNILVDTAQGVVSALASTPPNVPLSIAIGAIGAIQAGIVASQPIPKFATGTDNAPEGFALTQEKGAEIITDKSGKIKTLGNNKGAQMTYLSKGDKVFTAEQSTQLMHNQALNSILTSSGIMPTQIVNNSTNVDMSGVIKAIENKPSVINQVDKGGFRQLMTNGHTTKEITNRRIYGQSYGV